MLEVQNLCKSFGSLAVLQGVDLQVETGDVIGVREKSRDMEHFKALREGTTHVVPKWLTFEAEQLQGSVNALPQREDVDMAFEEHLIVELYSK